MAGRRWTEQDLMRARRGLAKADGNPTPAARRQPESEDGFQAAVIELAQRRGWMVAHFRPALSKTGWRTAVAADAAGFPDLVLVRRRVIFAELKSESGTTSNDQEKWIAALKAAGQEVYVWRPRDWDAIERALGP